MKLECKRLISDSVRNYVNYLNSRAYVKNTCANMHIPEHNSLISIKKHRVHVFGARGGRPLANPMISVYVIFGTSCN